MNGYDEASEMTEEHWQCIVDYMFRRIAHPHPPMMTFEPIVYRPLPTPQPSPTMLALFPGV